VSLGLDDPRWARLEGGYRTVCDPRPHLGTIVSGGSVAAAWSALWEDLHHQGDVGAASYAAIAVLGPWARSTGSDDWNVYALAATIEECRAEGDNPPVPAWCAPFYSAALDDLFHAAHERLPSAETDELIAGLFAILAIGKRRPLLARLALLTEKERAEMLDEVGWG